MSHHNDENTMLQMTLDHAAQVTCMDLYCLYCLYCLY